MFARRLQLAGRRPSMLGEDLEISWRFSRLATAIAAGFHDDPRGAVVRSPTAGLAVRWKGSPHTSLLHYKETVLRLPSPGKMRRPSGSYEQNSFHLNRA